MRGQVVGVNSAIATTGGIVSGQSGNIGVGFAIPSNAAAEVADEIVRDGRATHPQLGVGVADADSTQVGTPGAGAQLTAVTAGGPAASAGLQSGDVVTEVGDRTVTDADGLIVAVREHAPGDSVAVTYTRGGSTATVQVVLGTAPQS